MELQSRDLVWSHSRTVAWLTTGDSVIIVETGGEDSAPRILEGSAAAIWNGCDGTATAESIARELGLLYGVSPHELLLAIESFLGELAERGLLTSSA